MATRPLTVGVPAETKTAEHRVAMTPDGVRELERHGVEVFVQAGAGEGSAIADAEYETAGATIVPTAADAWSQQMVVKVKEPQGAELGLLRDDLTLFTYLHLAAYPEVAKALVAARTTALAYETVQTAAGALPLLAPMSAKNSASTSPGKTATSPSSTTTPQCTAGEPSQEQGKSSRRSLRWSESPDLNRHRRLRPRLRPAPVLVSLSSLPAPFPLH